MCSTNAYPTVSARCSVSNTAISYSSRRQAVPRLDLHDLHRKLVALDAQIDGRAEYALSALGPVERDRKRTILQPHGAEQSR